MTTRIMGPVVRLFNRWRTAQAVKHLDKRLREDAGLEIEERSWEEINIALVAPGAAFLMGKTGK